MRFKFSNSHRCTSFPPINSQRGTNKTHGQHAEYVEWLSCLLLNQLCNYLKDVLIVPCSTLNISQRFSSPPSKIDWINQSKLRVNRRPANQWCVWESLCVSGWGSASKHVCRKCARGKVYKVDSRVRSKGLLSILSVFGKQQAQSVSEQGSKTCVNSRVQPV